MEQRHGVMRGLLAIIFEMWKTALLVVAIRAALGSTNSNVEATTAHNKEMILELSTKYGKIHGLIKDRSSFADSPSAVRFKDFQEKYDRMIPVDLSGSDVTTVQHRNSSATAVTSLIISNWPLEERRLIFLVL